jgi:hypothetical protein
LESQTPPPVSTAETGPPDKQGAVSPKPSEGTRDQKPKPPAGSTTNPTIISLLDQYQAALSSHADRKRALPFRLRRLSVATDYFLVEHIRTVLDVLQRRCRAQAAIQPGPAEDPSDNLRRLDGFSASLPSRPSRWYLLGLGALIIIVAEGLLSFVGRRILAGTKQGSSLATELERLTSPAINAPAQAIRAVVHTNVYGVCFVAICLCLAAYIVLRPLANGLIASREILDSRTRGRWWPLRRRATRHEWAGVAPTEQRVFAHFEVTRPRESHLDLVIRMFPALAALFLAFGVLALYRHGLGVGGGPTNSKSGFEPPIITRTATLVGPADASITYHRHAAELVVALALGCLAAFRLGQLWNIYRARAPATSRRLAAHAAPSANHVAQPRRLRATLRPALLAGAVATGFIAYGTADIKPPSVKAHLAGRGDSPEPLAKNRLTITVSCDKSCSLNRALLGVAAGDQLPPPGIHADLAYQGFDNPANLGHGRFHTLFFPLTRAQNQWLIGKLQADAAQASPVSSFASVEIDMIADNHKDTAVILDLG